MELAKHFNKVNDFRVKGRCLHDLIDILVLILVGTLCDCDDFVEIRDYGIDKIDFLRNELGREYINGIPSEDTLERVMKHLLPKELEESMRACAGEISCHLSGKHICLDGKEHRGTIPEGNKHALIRTVSVWLVDDKLSFGQIQIASKTNEKTAIPALIEMLDIKGSIVTIDAIACQKNIIKTIVDSEADYMIALKKNQGSLYEQIHDLMIQRKSQLPYYESVNKEHGRGEHRKVYLCQDFSFLDKCQEWENLNSLVMVESTRITSKTTTNNISFYISSLQTEYPSKIS